MLRVLVTSRDTGGSGTGPTRDASASSTGPADARTSVRRPARLVEATGIEPATPCLQSRSSTTELRPRGRPAWPGAWWAYVDSNHRPYAYQAYALTT
jgi:hypothetical protein